MSSKKITITLDDTLIKLVYNFQQLDIDQRFLVDDDKAQQYFHVRDELIKQLTICINTTLRVS